MKRTLTMTVTLILLITLAIPARTTSWTQAQANKDLAHEIAEMMRAEGHPEDHPVILACQEWWQSENDIIETAVTEYTTAEQRKRYPTASLVWELLRQSGLSEPVAAGILGNMMAECGGQTLDLQPYIYASGFYGLCMWSLTYFPQIDGQDVHGQISVLLDTMPTNMGEAGYKYDSFLALTDARTAARWFSFGYERPAVWAEQRADNAEAALAYFGGR